MRGTSTPPVASADQAGVFTRGQATESGLSAKQIQRLVRDRRWVTLFGTVYADARTRLSPVSMAWAASLAAGTGAVVSHTTAAMIWGLLVPADPEAHVIVGRDRRPRIAGLRAHRIEVAENDLAYEHGILCTNLERTALDCLLWLPEAAGRALATDALRRGRLTAPGLRALVADAPQRHGLARAWGVVRDVCAGAHSEAEVIAHRILRAADVTGWRANVPIYDDDGLIGVVDLVFEAARLVAEIDGRAFHSDDEAFQRDRTRQNRLLAAGYRPLRFTWDDLTRRPDAVVATIRNALAEPHDGNWGRFAPLRGAS